MLYYKIIYDYHLYQIVFWKRHICMALWLYRGRERERVNKCIFIEFNEMNLHMWRSIWFLCVCIRWRVGLPLQQIKMKSQLSETFPSCPCTDMSWEVHYKFCILISDIWCYTYYLDSMPHFLKKSIIYIQPSEYFVINTCIHNLVIVTFITLALFKCK